MSGKISAPVSLSVSGSTFVGGWLSLNDIALLVGILGTISTVGITFYFKWREDCRREKIHQLELQAKTSEED